jgi:predicted GTPase
LIKDISNWLEESNSSINTIADYKSKLNSLQELVEPILFRYNELEQRDSIVKTTKDMLTKFKTDILNWNVSMPHLPVNETSLLLEKINVTDDWINEKVDQQLLHDQTQTPIFQSKDVTQKLKLIKSEYEKILKRPKPVIEKVNTFFL